MFKIETFNLSRGQELNRNFAKEYGYIFVVSGSIKFTLNDRSCIKLNNYHYFLFTPYDFVKMEAPIDSSIFIMRYKVAFLQNQVGKNSFLDIFNFDKENLNERIFHSNYQNYMFLKLFIDRFKYASTHSFKYNDIYLLSVANLTLINLNNAIELSDETKVKTRKISIDTILIYIRNNINHNFSVQDVADHFEVTSSYISAFYKKHTGISLSHTIIEYRLTTAINYLKEGMSVQEVYSMVGFNSYNHFFKQFKEYYHMSPLQYINNLTDEKETN